MTTTRLGSGLSLVAVALGGPRLRFAAIPWVLGFFLAPALQPPTTVAAAEQPEPRAAPPSEEFTAFLERRAEAETGQPVPVDPQQGGFGLIPSPVHIQPGQPQTPALEQASRGLLGFPSTYDLRTQSKLTPVKNQGSYGTCWAFASMGSLESCLKPSETWDFSENNLVNLDGFDPAFGAGGNLDMSTAYLVRWGGPVTETSDPYPHPNNSPVLPAVKHCHDVIMLPGRASSTDNGAIKQAVTDYGAVANDGKDDTPAFQKAMPWKR
jgi:C1A family cysteine protease